MTQVNFLSFALQDPGLLRAHATARQFDPHLHSTYSIVALKRGAAEIRSARWCGTARAGDVFFFNPFEVHSACCAGDGAEYAAFYPSRAFLVSCLGREPGDRPLTIQTTILQRNAATTALVDALFAPTSSIENPLRRVLAACDITTDPAVESHGALARRACLLIQNNSTRAMRTEELARRMGVHQSHLVRAFSNAVGMAPQTYIRQVRIAKARELICEGRDLSEVALMLDFSDQAHLTREFKKVFGVPPGTLSRHIGGHRPNTGRSRIARRD